MTFRCVIVIHTSLSTRCNSPLQLYIVAHSLQVRNLELSMKPSGSRLKCNLSAKSNLHPMHLVYKLRKYTLTARRTQSIPTISKQQIASAIFCTVIRRVALSPSTRGSAHVNPSARTKADETSPFSSRNV